VPVYAYKGIAKNGKATSGVRDAESPKALRQMLRKDGVVVTETSLSKARPGAKSGGKGLNKEVSIELFAAIKKTEVAAFARQAATMLRAGIPLAESLGALFEQLDHEKLKSVVGEVRVAVNEGQSFADALAKHPKVFDNLFVSMVRAGETAGNLDEVLTRLADFMESAAKLKSKVQGAMIYPVIMLVVGVAIMSVLMIAVVPKITGLFVDQGVALPLTTRILIWISDFLGNWWFGLLLFFGVAFAGFRYWIRTEDGRRAWHGAVLKMWLVGPLVRQVAVARFCRTMGTMLQAGVPMLKVLETSKAVLGNVVLIDVVEKAKVSVTEGESLAVTLKRSGHFPAGVTHMIAVGERSGSLEDMLLRVADDFESQVDIKLDRLTGMLEPIMLVVMGGAVAFVVFSILMPMMEMQKLTQV
jgi:general secretion pathway protein F